MPKMVLAKDETILRSMNEYSLVANFDMTKHLAESLAEVDSQEMLHSACVGMFNEIVTNLPKLENGHDLVLLANFVGLALEANMNITKMQEIADRRVEEFSNEISRRLTDASS